MKKFFFLLIASVLFSFGARAQGFIDFYSQNDGKSRTQVEKLDYQKGQSNLLFLLAHYGSLGDSTKSYFGDGEVFTGADYRGATKKYKNSVVSTYTQASYNKNLLFALINVNSTFKWKVRSVEGNLSSSKFCSTKDGGAVVCAKFNKIVIDKDSTGTKTSSGMTTITSNSYYYSTIFTIVDDFNDTIKFDSRMVNTRQQENVTVIFKVDKDGKISSSKSVLILPSDTGKTDAFTVNGITCDTADNIYICGTPTAGTEISYISGVDTQKITASNNLILKCDKDLKYVAKKTIATPSGLSLKQVIWSDSLLYCVGERTGAAKTKELFFAGMNSSLDNINSDVFTILRDSSTTKSKVNPNVDSTIYKSGFMLNTFVTYDNDTNLYIAGGVNGIIAVQNDTFRNENYAIANTGCLLIVNKKNFKVTKAALMPDKVFGLYYGFGKANDYYYTFHYTSGINNLDVKLYKYDSNLSVMNNGQGIVILSGSNAISAVYTKDTSFIIATTSNANKITFPGNLEYFAKTESFHTILVNSHQVSSYTIVGNNATLFETPNEVVATNDMTIDNKQVGTLTKSNINITAGTVLYRVVFNHNLEANYPAKPKELVITEDGQYNVTFTYNPFAVNVDEKLTAVLTKQGDDTSIKSLENENLIKVTKVIENGSIIIIRNGVKYNAQGQKME